MSDNPLGRLFQRDNLEKVLGSSRIEDLAGLVTPQYPPVVMPLPVEHRPPPTMARVNFTIKGVADFGPECYHGPSEDRVKSEIVDAMQMDPSVGQVAFKPVIYFEVTDVWDYTGGPSEQQPTTRPQPEGQPAPREDAGERELILSILADIAANVQRLQRDLADERAARALEAAVRQHGGEPGADPGLHGGSSETVSARASQRGEPTQRHDDEHHRPGRKRGRNHPRPAGSGDMAGIAGQPGDADAGGSGGTADPGEVRGSGEVATTPVVGAGARDDDPGQEAE